MRVLAAHIIVTAYGFWLPNDPRGSWSEFVAAWELLKFGKATKVETRRSVAHVPHDQALRREVKQAIRYEPVRFSGVQARAIARGFAQAVQESDCPLYACSILSDHVHLVVGDHQRSFEQITRHLKGRATQQIRKEQLHPFAEHEAPDGSLPTPWAGKLWKVFCFDPEHVCNAIRYVERNPVREGKILKSWSCVRRFAL